MASFLLLLLLLLLRAALYFFVLAAHFSCRYRIDCNPIKIVKRVFLTISYPHFFQFLFARCSYCCWHMVCTGIRAAAKRGKSQELLDANI